MELTEQFNPVQFSIPECQWLIDHLGQSPLAAREQVPSGVVAVAVLPEIERFYELQERDKQGRGLPWVGLGVIKASLQTYIDQNQKWESDWIRTKGKAPRVPPMCTFDSKNRPHFGAVGSDSGIVKTYFDGEGNRIPFAVDVVEQGYTEWQPEWAKKGVVKGTDPVGKGLKLDNEKFRFECLVCNHTETFKPESRSSLNAARARMAKHLRSANDPLKVEEHREALMELTS